MRPELLNVVAPAETLATNANPPQPAPEQRSISKPVSSEELSAQLIPIAEDDTEVMDRLLGRFGTEEIGGVWMFCWFDGGDGPTPL